jgi:5'-3' exonuclease
MGIKYLAKYLEENVDISSLQENIPANSTLLVDSSGFIFYLLSTLTNRQDREIGGGYENLDVAIHSHVTFLRFQLGLKLIFFFDGSAIQFKSGTMEKRKLQREERWLRLHDFCASGKKYELDELPIAPMSIEQLICYLSRNNIESVKCVGESDPEMAKMCQSINLNGGKAYCYGQDRYNMLIYYYFMS